MGGIMSKKTFLILLLVSVWAGCLKPDIESSSTGVFQSFWTEMDRHYAYFDYKGTDWDAIHTQYAPQAAQADEEALRDLLCTIIQDLEDGHVNLYTPAGICGYPFWERGPSGAPDLERISLTAAVDFSTVLYGGYLQQQPELGYIWIKNFSSEIGEYAAIGEALDYFSGSRGLIIDLRGNGGGSDRSSELVAGHFATKETLYRRFRYRNGPNHDDFTPWIEDNIAPLGNTYTKPVLLLTNRSCFSSTEDFILAMKRFDHVQTVGDTTGGGSGNPIFRELPNGWIYRFSHWQMQTADGRFFEGIGLPPDHYQHSSAEDNTDRILERSIELLN